MHNSNSSAFWLRKLVSPTGLVLACMLLFMPFVGVACGPFEAEISGWDMAVGGEPSVSTGGFGSDTSTGNSSGADDIPVQPLMLVTVLLMLTGIIVGLAVRPTYARALCGLIVVALTTLSLGLNEAIVLDKLVTEVASSNDVTEGDAAQIVGTRSGFWLTLSLYVAILLYHAVELWLEGRRRAYQTWLAYHGPPPGLPPAYPYSPTRADWPRPPNPYTQQPPPGDFQR